MKPQPLVSIITVVYNGAKTLEQTIKSVLDQTYENIEYIIIDGLSTDGSIDIIKKYEAQIEFWISEKDSGLYDAMNKGITRAKGEIVGIINSDDWYEKNAVELIIEAYKKHPEKKIFHGDRYDIDCSGAKKIRRFNPSRIKFIYYGMTYNHPSMFIHKDVYEESSYNNALISLSDYQFVLTQYIKNKNLFFYIPSAYVNYRLGGVSAKLSLYEKLYEGYICRKSAGLGFFTNAISLIVRLIIFKLY